MSTQIQQPNDDEITLTDIWMKVQEWWAYLWKRKAWILAIAFIFSVGGYLRVKLAKPVYSATVSYRVKQETDSIMSSKYTHFIESANGF